MSVVKAQVYLYTRNLQGSMSSSSSSSFFNPIDFLFSPSTTQALNTLTQLFPVFRHWGVLVKFPNGGCKLCEAHEENMFLKGKIEDVTEEDFNKGDARYLGETEVSEEELERAVENLNGSEKVYMLTCQNCQSWVKDLCQFLRVKVNELSSSECGFVNPLVDAAYLGVSEMLRNST